MILVHNGVVREVLKFFVINKGGLLKTNLVRPKKAHLTEVSKCHGSFRRHD
jgi:hypothetical protein